MIKHRRDKTHLHSSTKVFIEDYPGKFYRVCLWETAEAMCNASAEQMPENTRAFCCHASYLMRTSDAGPLQVRVPNLLGELHFVREDWDEEVVAHECFHATTNILKLLFVDPRLGIEEEEIAAYIHGELFSAVYRWLWSIDAHGKHA